MEFTIDHVDYDSSFWTLCKDSQIDPDSNVIDVPHYGLCQVVACLRGGKNGGTVVLNRVNDGYPTL